LVSRGIEITATSAIRPLAGLLADHDAAATEFLELAASVSPDDWHVPRAPGKWTPAQETKHLILGYEAFVRDLRGEGRLRVRGRWWQRRLWRWVVLTRIFARGEMVRTAPAPREVRPAERPGDKEALLADFRRAVSTFRTTIVETQRTSPRRCVTHPYFDALTLSQLLRLCAIHTRHHAGFLQRQA